MPRAVIHAVQPVLAARDVRALAEFYVGRLGFTLAGVDDPHDPRYAVVRRDAAELHLQWNDPASWGDGDRPMYRFLVPEVERLFEEYQDRGVFHERTALRETAWGTVEFAFYDPDRNGLTFYRPVKRD